MDSKKIIFILTLLGIFILIFLSNYTKQFQIGIIKDIKVSPTKTTITLEENKIELIIFDKITDIKEGDKIKFQGRKQIYQDEEQIIIDKIYSIKHLKFEN